MSEQQRNPGNGPGRPYGTPQQGNSWTTSQQSGAYPPPQRPSGGTYGSTQGYRPYQRPQQQTTYSSPPPYQYNTAGGWQQQPPEEKYRFDFEELDKAGSKRGKRKNRGLVVFVVCVVCMVSVAVIALGGYGLWNHLLAPSETVRDVEGGEDAPIDDGERVQMQITNKPLETESPVVEGERMSTVQVARQVRPAVVGVINYENNYFFGPASEGSGIIMTDDGYIITNEHVVYGADALVVVLEDGTEVQAELVGADARTDLAVIKIDRSGLPVAVFGDSDALEVGETVIAIGNPAGIEFAGSVTQGIVSAVNRVVRTPYYQMNYIQTDAAINPGNSGGALCNEFGQVVGINSSKIVAEGYEGMSFAIPIAEAKPIVDDLILNGRVTGRVLIGITGEPVGEVIANRNEIPAGVQIMSITNEELIEKGVLRGDIITHIDDERVLDMNDIRSIIERKGGGETCRLTLFRQTTVTQTRTFDVEITLIEDTGE